MLHCGRGGVKGCQRPKVVSSTYPPSPHSASSTPRLEAPREMRLARITVPVGYLADIQAAGLRAAERAVGEFEAALGDVAAR